MRNLKPLFLIALLAAAPLSAATVGHVVAFVGEGHIFPGGSEQAAVKVAPNSPIDLGDILATGVDSKMQVLFEDDTVLTVGPETRLQIDESVYDPKHQQRVSKVRLLWGKVRSVVRKGWGRQHRYEVETDAAVVGVKGTEFVVIAPRPGEQKYGDGGAQGCHSFVVVGGVVHVDPKEEDLAGTDAGESMKIDVCPGQIFQEKLSDEELRRILEEVILQSYGAPGVAQFDSFGEEGWENLMQVVREVFYNQQEEVIDDPTDAVIARSGGPTGGSGPSGPTSQPSGPTSQPSGPTSQPSGPTSQPSGPTSQPSGPTSQPSGPTSQPSGPTSQPSGPTSQPSGPTGGPTGMTGGGRGGGGKGSSGPGRGNTNPSTGWEPGGDFTTGPSFGDFNPSFFPQEKTSKPKRTTRPLQGATRPRGRNSRR